FARHQHKPAALLEHHVGGAMNEVLADAVRDGAERAHGAWHHHHAVGEERAGGDLRRHVGGVVMDGSQLRHLLHGVGRLMLERAARPTADNEVGFHLAFFKRLEQPDPQDGAGCAGQGYDQTPHRLSSLARHYSYSIRGRSSVSLWPKPWVLSIKTIRVGVRQ